MPLAVIVKYDIYDPNTDVADNDIGLNGTGTGDVVGYRDWETDRKSVV